jgi:hypothetical protein
MLAFRAPKYPTKLEVQSDSSILERSLPESWLRNSALSGAAALAISTISTGAGCATAPRRVTPPAHAIVAPIFEHGSGFASAGCVSVAPPGFLSEEEALKVIADEASKRGITLLRNYRPASGVSLSRCDASRIPNDAPAAQNQPFVPELVDPERTLAVSYFSEEQACWAGGEFNDSTASMRIDAARASSLVSTADAEPMYFATFYEPHEYRSTDASTNLKRNRALLREQVIDFLNWLQAQGAL